eukprot:TRINITY_DN2913_c0_g1_i2.p2 TRINITY_DN2913_c0_g1~~TRINITY_DN2913_c0_g1_i2.p2  ORF type:complete len:128 (+),score=10.46 TRINITY_DN2913_c0_g1_i2:348-731(+)
MPRTGPLLLTAAVTLPAADCSWYFFGSGTCLGPPVSGTQDAYYNECQKHPLTLAECQSACDGVAICLSVSRHTHGDCRLNLPTGHRRPAGVCDAWYPRADQDAARNPVTSTNGASGVSVWERRSACR